MDDEMLPALQSILAAGRAARLQEGARALAAMNSRTGVHGHSLTEAEIAGLVQSHARVLHEAGRVEFGESVLPLLAHAFCDSPHIAPEGYAAALDELTALFYHTKSETADAVSDNELIDFMRRHFNGDCHGSAELLRDIWLEPLGAAARAGHAAAVLWPDAPDAGGEEEGVADDEADD